MGNDQRPQNDTDSSLTSREGLSPFAIRALSSRPGRELQKLSGVLFFGEWARFLSAILPLLFVLFGATILSWRLSAHLLALPSCGKVCLDTAHIGGGCCSWDPALLIRGALALIPAAIAASIVLSLVTPSRRTMLSGVATALAELTLVILCLRVPLSLGASIFWVCVLFFALFGAYRSSYWLARRWRRARSAGL